jgi:hypothetical protein
MQRRDLASALFISSTAAVLLSEKTQAQSCTAPCYARTVAESAAGVTPVNSALPPGNVLRYQTNTTPGTTDMSAAFQAAFNQQTSGGVPVYVPTGAYMIASIISTRTAAPFVMYGDGIGKTVITKSVDADCFVVTNSGSAFNEIAISDLTITPGVAMSTGAAFNLTCTGIIPSVTMRNVMILCGGGSVFGTGIKLSNCGEVEMNRVFIYGLNSSSMVGIAVSQSVASTDYKFIGCSIYNVAFGVSFTDTTRPGIEGIQFYGCDIVGVNLAVIYTNNFGTGYFPPQLTWIGGHINAAFRAFDLSIMTQVFIQGLLSYNSGTSQHIILLNVSDVNIQGCEFVQIGGTADGITMGGSATLNGGIIANNMFRMAASGKAINVISANNFKNLTISGNQRAGGSVTVNTTGTIDNTVLIRDNTPVDTLDIFDTTLSPAASMNLAGIRSDYCVIGAPTANVVTAVLTSRRLNDRVILDGQSTASFTHTIQHNAANPNGFYLSGAANYVFPINGGRLTLELRNGGYWTEVGRS